MADKRWRFLLSKLDTVWLLGVGLVIARAVFKKAQIDDNLLYVGMVLIGLGLGFRWNGGFK